jgi:hypothetical protein
MSVRRTAAALLTAGLLLTGCSDDPEPRFEPTETPSPTESSATAEPQAQSPEEFIREWFALNTEMQNTGDTQAFLASSRPCDVCKDMASQVRRIYADGGRIQLDRQEVLRVRTGARSATIKQFDVTVEASKTRLVEAAGASEQTLPGGKSTYRVTLLRKGDAWAMNFISGA